MWTGLGLNPGMCSETPVTNQRRAYEGTGVLQVILLVVTYVCDVACLKKEHICQVFEKTGLRNTRTSE
jgi:hypothetical protein